MIDTVQVKDFPTIEESEGIVLVDKPTGIHQWMAVNVTQPPFDDIKLREAVLSAIDVNVIEQVVSKGYGVVTPTLVPPSEWIFDGSLKSTPFDPERAKALLAETAFTDTITISVIQRDPDTQIAQIVQSMLGQAGFKVEVEILERQAWVEKVLTRNHEIGLLRINVPRVDTAMVFSTLMGPDMVGAGPAFTIKGISDPTGDPELLEKRIRLFKAMSDPCVDVRDCGFDTQVAHFGEMNATLGRKHGATGAVVDGGVRDGRHLLKMEFPVFCRYFAPVEAKKRWSYFKWQVPVTLRGATTATVTVNPGDFIFGDIDGVIVVPKELTHRVLEEAEARVAREDRGRSEYVEGDVEEVYRRYGTL